MAASSSQRPGSSRSAYAALPARLRDTPTAGALISLAGLVDLADLKGKVDELCAALAPDVTDSDLADARETGELTLTDVGAQTRLGGHTDALTGEWLRDVLAAKAEADRGLADPRTSGQRLLDALLDCVRVAIDAGAVPGSDGTPPTLVVVSTETDLLRTAEPGAEQVDAEDALADLFADLPEDLPADPHSDPATSGSPATGGGRGTGGGDRCGSARPGHHTTGPDAGRPAAAAASGSDPAASPPSRAPPPSPGCSPTLPAGRSTAARRRVSSAAGNAARSSTAPATAANAPAAADPPPSASPTTSSPGPSAAPAPSPTPSCSAAAATTCSTTATGPSPSPTTAASAPAAGSPAATTHLPPGHPEPALTWPRTTRPRLGPGRAVSSR